MIYDQYIRKIHKPVLCQDVDTYFTEARKESRLDEINADERLYKSIFQDEIQDYLCKSKGIDSKGLIAEDEVNSIRYNILYN